MKFIYNGDSLKSGIYEIRNRYTNRSYIGQAKEFKERWMGHKSNLLTGKKRKNQFLLNDFNKCLEVLGHDDFLEFHILEVMENSTREIRNKREEYWIQEYKNHYGKRNVYNFRTKINDKDCCWSHTPEETRKRYSKAQKKAYRKKIKAEAVLLGISAYKVKSLKKKQQAQYRKEWVRESGKGPAYTAEYRQRLIEELGHEEYKKLDAQQRREWYASLPEYKKKEQRKKDSKYRKNKRATETSEQRAKRLETARKWRERNPDKIALKKQRARERYHANKEK